MKLSADSAGRHFNRANERADKQCRLAAVVMATQPQSSAARRARVFQTCRRVAAGCGCRGRRPQGARGTANAPGSMALTKLRNCKWEEGAVRRVLSQDFGEWGLSQWARSPRRVGSGRVVCNARADGAGGPLHLNAARQCATRACNMGEPLLGPRRRAQICYVTGWEVRLSRAGLKAEPPFLHGHVARSAPRSQWLCCPQCGCWPAWPAAVPTAMDTDMPVHSARRGGAGRGGSLGCLGTKNEATTRRRRGLVQGSARPRPEAATDWTRRHAPGCRH